MWKGEFSRDRQVIIGEILGKHYKPLTIRHHTRHNDGLVLDSFLSETKWPTVENVPIFYDSRQVSPTNITTLKLFVAEAGTPPGQKYVNRRMLVGEFEAVDAPATTFVIGNVHLCDGGDHKLPSGDKRQKKINEAADHCVVDRWYEIGPGRHSSQSVCRIAQNNQLSSPTLARPSSSEGRVGNTT